ncbi:unnamed protein product [Pieris macdunnoughi]|uniref:Down syndrome cell adhesion molecule-like protein Dscam2 n=1 Tax=Pieris macdunnoughi TaxID=345717 RepID=A0A821SXX9_9NEOP|nr:unnamed protein product [Pieris macdunnoughi]
MDVPWEVQVQASPGVAGGAALLTCITPRPVRNYVSVTRWYKDGSVLASMASDSGHHIIGGSRGDMLLIRNARPEDSSSYSCEAQHQLTGEKRRSPPAMTAVSHGSGSMAPRILTISEDETVPQGGDIRLVCCAIGSPTPTYSWFRHSNGRLSPVSNNIRISVSEQVLIIRRAQVSDGGVWSCRAHNQYGEQRRDTTLRIRARLVVTVHPQLQIANSGSSVTFNCSVEGGDSRVRWLHDGVPVGGGERVLRVHGVVRAHRGMYQCFAEREMDSAQAAAELRLGDTAPELHYTFIEQALHPGPVVALHCSASGSPSPRFSWLLDMQPIEEHNTPQRSITQFLSPNGDVVSYLNLTSVRPEDGGRYTCRAHNSRGAVEHSTRLNVYGPPSIRNISPVRVVAGVNTTIYCPYSGFPISEIRWQRGGTDISASGGRALSGVGGELLLWPAEPSDAGLYSCRVSSPEGHYAQKDVQIFVRNPPKIAGFTFPSDLVEGSSIQVLCGITSGDKPVYFSWLKDGQTLPSNLQVQEKSLDEFSFLIFSHVTSQHSGEYTCVASNSASEVNHTARLAVKVAPSWVFEPQDVSALLGTPILVHCSTKGYPEPKISWHKGHGSNPTDFRPLTGLEAAISLLGNGSLSALSASHTHEGRYMCRSDNGVGRGLSKIITISVNEPAQFEYSSRNMSVRRTASVTLSCAARGDSPIQLHWTHNMRPLDLNTYRVSVSEKRSESGASSELTIAHAQRRDSGVYRCRAENAYGRDELLIYLAVQEFPEAPRGLSVKQREGRAATVQWRRGFDGNARLRAFRLQYRVVGHTQLPPDWSLAPTRELPADILVQKQESSDPESGVLLEYRVEGLRPATAYALRLAAVNDIGDSDYSDSVIVNTLEEAPSEPPRGVELLPDAPGELLIKWQAPSQEAWNGELLGYAIWCRGENASLSLSVAGWAAASVRLGALRPHARYDVTVRAYNSVGAGPASTPLATTTLEDVPDAPPQHVRCEPLSSQSLRVWWEPPPLDKRGGMLIGYEISYRSVERESGVWERRRAGSGEAQLSVLRAGNYSVRIAARSTAGLGVPAHIYCATLDDIPGPPADVKVFPHTEDSVILSWLPPMQKNGQILHYRVYTRPQRIGRQSEVVTISSGQQDQEQQLVVSGLQQQLYELWVSAATAAGEGDMSTIVAAKPSAKVKFLNDNYLKQFYMISIERKTYSKLHLPGIRGAKVSSFPRRLTVPVGSSIAISCFAAGALPVSRLWTRRRPPPPHADHRIRMEGHMLVINKVEPSLADNYTCTARNRWGEDHGTWELMALPPPSPPRLTLTSASPTALILAWDSSGAHSYSLEYARGEAPWQYRWVWGAARSTALRGLACGASYRVRLRAMGDAGAALSDVLRTATPGGLSKAALEKQLINTNSTCVKLNLLTWDCNGCPLIHFIISIRGFEEFSWKSESVELEANPVTFCTLRPATWYHLRIVATTTAGVTTATYYFATLTEGGERIPAPAQFPSGGEDIVSNGGGVALLAAAAAFVTALMLLAVVAYKRSSRVKCFTKGYEPSSVSEDEKSVEKRDNRRNCQQVYTSSPIKTSKKDQQEMYEISPYATFSMSSGAVCSESVDTAGSVKSVGPVGTVGSVGTGASGTLRTFGRAEPAPLSAAPPHRSHMHRDPVDSDEYTLSRAMTLMVRRGESDSDSSGSPEPCAECTSSAAYRIHCAVPNKEEVFRGVTDSSAESCTSGSRDKARRRPRRHTPTSARYPQRQEQERRDFTIHV